MSYLTVQDVQSWLQADKYPITVVNGEFESLACQTVFGKLEQRYDTTAWIDIATTPVLVLKLIGMLVAAYELSKVVGEEDGQQGYADKLEARAMQLCQDIVDSVIELTDAVEDPTSSLGGGPVFEPTDATTALGLIDSWDPVGDPQAFQMNKVF